MGDVDFGCSFHCYTRAIDDSISGMIYLLVHLSSLIAFQITYKLTKHDLNVATIFTAVQFFGVSLILLLDLPIVSHEPHIILRYCEVLSSCSP
jgi:hypothetical protein